MKPPAHIRLKKTDLPFWTGILRSRDEWSDTDLVVAAQLARCQRAIEVESRSLQVEGTVITNAHGRRVVSPRFALVQRLVVHEMALMRALGLGGRAAGDARDQASKRAMQRQAQRILEDLQAEELLAGAPVPRALP